MTPIPIAQFADSSSQNIISYNFDPDLRDEDGQGPVCLERISRPIDPNDVLTTLYPEPKTGEEFFRYTAEDGGDVRYQYDLGSRNGKDYVVAIHRTPENWKRLMDENLGVKGGAKEWERRYQERVHGQEGRGMGFGQTGIKRRDSGKWVG